LSASDNVNEVLGPLATEFVRNFGREDATPYQHGSNASLLDRVQAIELISHRRSDFYPEAQIRQMGCPKKCRLLSKKCKSNYRSALNITPQTADQRAPDAGRAGEPSTRKAAMKRCTLCHGRLGLGVRFRNVWNGRWWVHVRFCSVRCEGIYEVRRNEAAKHRWHIFLAPSNSRS
jgi:hypothetical protein